MCEKTSKEKDKNKKCGKAKDNERKYSIEYSLPGNDDNDDVKVCQAFFNQHLRNIEKSIELSYTFNWSGDWNCDYR